MKKRPKLYSKKYFPTVQEDMDNLIKILKFFKKFGKKVGN